MLPLQMPIQMYIYPVLLRITEKIIVRDFMYFICIHISMSQRGVATQYTLGRIFHCLNTLQIFLRIRYRWWKNSEIDPYFAKVMLPLLTGARQQFIVNDTKIGGILNLQLAQGMYSSIF